MRNLLIILSFIGLAVISEAQTYPLNDAAFITYLEENHPTLLSTEKELIITEAESLSGALVMSNKGIQNLDGLQYFKSIQQVYVADNDITFIPVLDSLKSVQTFHINNCGLSALPKMDGMILLKEFEAYNNQLTSLEAIKNLPSLTSVTAYKNQITTIPSFSNAAEFTFLHVGGNPLQALPDFSSYPNLVGLELWGTGISSTPDLSSLLKLKLINLGSNSLTDAPDFSSLTVLESIYLDNNLFRELPNGINESTNLKQVNISNNRLSLNDLKEITSINNYTSIFTITPQLPFPLQSNYEKVTGNSILLTTDNDINVEGVSYTLFKEDKQVAQNTTGSFSFKNIQLDFEGVYTIQIKTTLLPDVYLSSTPIKVNITPCVNTDMIDVEISTPNCINKGSIFINNHSDSTLLYTLSNNEKSSSGTFNSLQPGMYTLNLGTTTCNIGYPSLIAVEQVECREFLLSPNDGNKTVSLDFEGDITIYDKQGSKLDTLTGPVEWDGKIDGALLPVGYYFIDFGDGKEHVLVSIIY